MTQNPLDAIYAQLVSGKSAQSNRSRTHTPPSNAFPSLVVQPSSYAIPIRPNSVVLENKLLGPISMNLFGEANPVQEQNVPFASTWDVKQAKAQLQPIITTDILSQKKKLAQYMHSAEFSREGLIMPSLLKFLFEPKVSADERKSEQKLLEVLQLIIENGGFG